MSPTESDIFCWGGGLKKVAASGLFGVFAVAVGAVGRCICDCCCRIRCASCGLLWSPLVAAPLLRSASLGFDVATLFNIILIIDQHLSTNSGRNRWARKN